MLKYVAKRLLEVIPTTVGILLLTFVLFNVVGGSPAETILGKNATKESISAFNHKWGYDKPLIFGDCSGCSIVRLFDSQFGHFVGDLCRGDFGYSIENNEPVVDVLKRGVGPSLSLTVPILVGGVVVALMLAMVSAAARGGAVDRAVLVGSTVLMSVNYVVWVLAGQFFLSYKAGFPGLGLSGRVLSRSARADRHRLVAGVDVRFFRTAILDEVYKPYVLTARAKGLSS